MSVGLTTARGHPSREQRLPTDLAAVDAAWLQGVLRHCYPGIAITAMEVVEIIQGHTTKVRVAVTGSDPAVLPGRLCLKSNWSGSPLSGEANVNEARFYKDLCEGLQLPAPHCFYADWDDDADGKQGLLVLEDMEGWDGKFGTSAEPITIDQAMRGVAALATLHASTWADPRLDAAGWLQRAMAPDHAGDDYWAMMADHYDKVNRLPERVAMFPAWFANDPQKLRDAWLQLCAHDMADTSPLCLVHGDAHLGNSYGLGDGGRLFLDWQIVRKGHPWRDYSYFAAGSITIADRRAGERDLLKHYLSVLAQHGIVIDFDTAWTEYRRWIVWGLVSWQSNINPKEATLPSLERFCVAAKDLKIDELYNV
ncbi:ecdysteroid 22-kinase family protein [Novosphingobium sp. CECT 9465]|uniref:ecdysteroid 22-kinase family protein n=1 Tax=Novosphingobium sp. CECT 9465 TaxID=2829794 RepID=UPI001E5D05D5|nr:ecdysteroid 22-kinase family protein [Novosphingobium sp. CECT 9465]